MTDREQLTREGFEGRRTAPRRHDTLRRIGILGLTLLVVLAAVLAAAYLDLSDLDALRRALSYDKTESAGENTYRYDNDRTNVYALLGDRLLVASTTRVSVLADDGEEVYSREVRFTNPAISVGGRTAAVYDVGGTALYIIGESGLVRDLSGETDSGVVSARLNSSDFLALVTERSGYKSSLSVFTPTFERPFTYNSSNRYLLDACCERDGKHVAVVVLGESEGAFTSTVRRYALDQETALSDCPLADTLVYELASFGGTLVALGDTRFAALAADGSLAGSYEYPYPYLRDATLGGADFGALLLSRYRSGSAGRLVTVGAEGGLLASLELQRDVLDLSAAGDYLAVLYGDALVLYTADLTEYATLTDTKTARAVRMRPDGTAVLLGSTSAWLYVP